MRSAKYSLFENYFNCSGGLVQNDFILTGSSHFEIEDSDCKGKLILNQSKQFAKIIFFDQFLILVSVKICTK